MSSDRPQHAKRPRFLADRSGMAATEFAFVAPILIVILFGIIEIPRAYGTSQALFRSVRTMADLISRGSISDVSDVYAAGNAVTYPTDTSAAGVILTAVGVYKQGGALVAKVCSSVARNASAYAPGSVLGDPATAEATEGARYVQAEVNFHYVPILNFFPFLSNLTFSKSITWPVRGVGANSYVETVLPGGSPCPTS